MRAGHRNACSEQTRTALRRRVDGTITTPAIYIRPAVQTITPSATPHRSAMQVRNSSDQGSDRAMMRRPITYRLPRPPSRSTPTAWRT